MPQWQASRWQHAEALPFRARCQWLWCGSRQPPQRFSHLPPASRPSTARRGVSELARTTTAARAGRTACRRHPSNPQLLSSRHEAESCIIIDCVALQHAYRARGNRAAHSGGHCDSFFVMEQRRQVGMQHAEHRHR